VKRPIDAWKEDVNYWKGRAEGAENRLTLIIDIEKNGDEGDYKKEYISLLEETIKEKQEEKKNLGEEVKKIKNKIVEVSNSNNDWFTPKKWLTDKEIDWACQQLEKSDKHKILPSHQFHYVREAGRLIEAEAYKSFPELLVELDDCELVFISVVQNEFHWSLLVYETKSKTFYHYDTLNGANYEYVKPLVKDILVKGREIPESEWESHLIPQHDIHQGNGYDCGVAVIALVVRIMEKYDGSLNSIELGEFDFGKVREEMRMKYLNKKKQESQEDLKNLTSLEKEFLTYLKEELLSKERKIQKLEESINGLNGNAVAENVEVSHPLLGSIKCGKINKTGLFIMVPAVMIFSVLSYVFGHFLPSK